MDKKRKGFTGFSGVAAAYPGKRQSVCQVWRCPGVQHLYPGRKRKRETNRIVFAESQRMETVRFCPSPVQRSGERVATVSPAGWSGRVLPYAAAKREIVSLNSCGILFTKQKIKDN
jgi:hypothetical protein